MTTLQPKQFHGARIEVKDTHIRPPSQTGATTYSSSGYSSGSDRPSHKDLAFATNAEQTAWRYAQVVPQDKDHPVNNDPDPKHRSRVYTVARASDQTKDLSEIESKKGYKITGEHHVEKGATGTFPSINWNAFKDKTKASPFVSHMDMNHSYMQDRGPVKTMPEPHVEVPGQMNLFSGKTHEEQSHYENIPGMQLSHQFSAVDISHYQKDTASKQARAKKQYHWVDEHFGTVQ